MEAELAKGQGPDKPSEGTVPTAVALAVAPAEAKANEARTQEAVAQKLKDLDAREQAVGSKEAKDKEAVARRLRDIESREQAVSSKEAKDREATALRLKDIEAREQAVTSKEAKDREAKWEEGKHKEGLKLKVSPALMLFTCWLLDLHTVEAAGLCSRMPTYCILVCCRLHWQSLFCLGTL